MYIFMHHKPLSPQSILRETRREDVYVLAKVVEIVIAQKTLIVSVLIVQSE